MAKAVFWAELEILLAETETFSMMQREKLQISKTAKICKMGAWDQPAQLTWLCLHGYGMLAQYFIKNFAEIDDGNNLFIAPEAPNRFYLNGTYGRVGATWMTKEEREDDIADIIQYIDQVHQTLSATQQAQLVALGFSQGTPSVFRWAVAKRAKLRALVAWASDIPKDVLTPEGIQYLNSINVYLVVGTQDEFIFEQRLQAFRDLLKEVGLNYKFISFDGKHRIDKEPLQQLYTLINE